MSWIPGFLRQKPTRIDMRDIVVGLKKEAYKMRRDRSLLSGQIYKV